MATRLLPWPDGAGRDFDADGEPTERDPDSDSGGCPDGEEDANFNGHRDESETWNFDKSDDLCSGLGWVGHATAVHTTRSPGFEISVSLTARDVVFELASPGYYEPVSGEVGWVMTGGGGGCTYSGEGTKTLERDASSLGWLVINAAASTYVGQAGLVIPDLITWTCADATLMMPIPVTHNQWLGTRPAERFDPKTGILEGTFSNSDAHPGVDLTSEWTWRFAPGS